MLKLKVEWRNTCNNCGVKLVTDFATDADGYRMCPWCGCVEENELPPDGNGFRSYVSETIGQLENDINNRITCKKA